MADVTSVLDQQGTGGKTYWDETEDKPSVRMPEGSYPAHIVEVETVERTVKGRYKAMIYNYTVKIAEEAKSITFDAVDFDGNSVQVNGGDYAGRTIRSNGVFKFLHPENGEGFEPYPSGNKGYANFCKVLGTEMPIKTVEIDGNEVKVRELPDLAEDDILGKPVKAIIKYGKPWTSNKDGKTRTYLEVKWLANWEDGKTVEVDVMSTDKDDLPF